MRLPRRTPSASALRRRRKRRSRQRSPRVSLSLRTLAEMWLTRDVRFLKCSPSHMHFCWNAAHVLCCLTEMCPHMHVLWPGWTLFSPCHASSAIL
eukprot:4318915-Pleurochrysis_carterae.AAC.1